LIGVWFHYGSKKGQGRVMKMVATTIKSGGCESQSAALKRLASAVRFRPWPPYFSVIYENRFQKTWVQLGAKNSGLPEKLPHSFFRL